MTKSSNESDEKPPDDASDPEPPASSDAEPESSKKRDRCDFCRLPIPGDPVTVDQNGETYGYCSASCRESAEDHDKVFTQYHGFRRVPTGVDPLDESLPQGIPRNSFVLLTDLAGTRTASIQAELIWRTLQRGEPAVYVSFLEPPMSVIQEFVTLDWNVLPYLESGQLQILDCFTYRLEHRERMYERLNDWNSFLSTTAADATSQVRDPSELGELHNRIDDVLEAQNMEDQGVVVIDSLTEFGSLVQPIQAYDFLKDVRAEVCKSRFVPIYAGATVTSEEQTFPHDLKYMVDGVVELNLNEELVEGSLLKQLRVRKMSGVLTLPKWILYEYTAGDGIVTIEIHEGPPDEAAPEQERDAGTEDDRGEQPAPTTDSEPNSDGHGQGPPVEPSAGPGPADESSSDEES